MTHHHARLIVVAVATVSFSTPITAQQEPTPQEVADIRVRAEQGEAEAQYQLGKSLSILVRYLDPGPSLTLNLRWTNWEPPDGIGLISWVILADW